MGKKGSQIKNGGNLRYNATTLREESLGKKEAKVSAKSMLKVQHLKNLAKWASVEASVPSLGAFFGHRLADWNEDLGLSADPASFTCQRCESILQPGSNCTVRIENNRAKARRCKKLKNLLQNNVVYKCHFCSHPNLTRGTPKGHFKELYPPKDKARPKPKCANSNLVMAPISDKVNLEDSVGNEKPEAASGRYMTASTEVAMSDVLKDDSNNPVTPASGRDMTASTEVAMSDVLKDDSNNPVTPAAKTGMTLLEARSKKRNRSKSKKATESQISSKDAEETVSASNKRKRKSWTSLKEIAESSANSNGRNLTNLPIPFFI